MISSLWVIIEKANPIHHVTPAPPQAKKPHHNKDKDKYEGEHKYKYSPPPRKSGCWKGRAHSWPGTAARSPPRRSRSPEIVARFEVVVMMMMRMMGVRMMMRRKRMRKRRRSKRTFVILVFVPSGSRVRLSVFFNTFLIFLSDFEGDSHSLRTKSSITISRRSDIYFVPLLLLDQQ